MFGSVYDCSNSLKKIRKENNLSQKELAKLSGISQGALANYEKGIRKISKEIDSVLSQILKVDTVLMNQNNQVEKLISQVLAYQEVINLSNNVLAKKIGIDAATLSRILNGKRKASKNIQQKFIIFLSGDGKEILMNNKQEGDIFQLPIVDKIAMGKRIQTIRKIKEVTLEKFGKKFTLQVGKNVVSRWEKGVNIPDIERLMNIADLGEVTVPYILYGDAFSNMLKTGTTICRFEKLDSIRIGLRLRKIRMDYRLEREEFGKIFSPPIRKWSMDRYENGNDIPNTDRIIQYAYVGKVSLEFLIYGI